MRFCRGTIVYYHFNDVHTPLQSTSIITYADDTVIFTAAKDLKSIQRHLSEDCHTRLLGFVIMSLSLI